MWSKLEEIPILKKGGIHIKKKNRGKFTESANRAGMGVQEFANHVLANKDKYSTTLVKRANFARNANKFKHANGGILKAQGGTTEGFWSKLWNAVKEGGMAARDARIGAVGAQQVRDLYSEGKNQEAQNLAQRYAKANTTGIALAGGAASTGLLGDLMVTGATTAADTFIDGNTKDFSKNLSINAAFDLVGHGIGKILRNVNWRNHTKVVPNSSKADISEYINTIDDELIDPVHLEWVAKSEQIDRFNKFAKKYGYPEITDKNISNAKLDELTKNMLERHNTYFRGVTVTPEVEDLAKKLNITEDEALKIAATTPRAGEGHIFISPTDNASIYGVGTSARIRRPYQLGSDRTKWFNEANFQIEAPHFYGGDPNAEVIDPWFSDTILGDSVPNELLLKKGEFVDWVTGDLEGLGSNNRIFTKYNRILNRKEVLPLEKFVSGGKL